MGFLAPAMPWIIKGGSALVGALMSRKSQKSATTRSPEEQDALQGGQQAAQQLQQTGGQLVSEGRTTLQQPTSYWSRLLGGNRALMAQATAAPRAAITDVYRGAERGLERLGRTATTTARAELQREQAGRISSLITGVQPSAAEALTGIGGTQIGAGAPMLGQAGGIYQNLLGQGAENRQYGRAEGEKTGKRVGGFLFDILSGTLGKKFGGGGLLPSKPLPISYMPTPGG